LGNANIGNDKEFLLRVVTQLLPFISSAVPGR
jgi:hypothetical protein